MGFLRQQSAERARSIRWCHSLLLAIAMSAGAVAGGCGSTSDVASGPTQLKCQVALAAPSSSIGPDGGTGLITVTTSPECPWDVSTGATWLSGLSPTSGQGPGTVEFRAAPNPLPSVREGEIIVNENRLRVSQQAAACRLELLSDGLTIDAGGGTREVAVSAPSACSWTAATDASWISFTTPVTRSGDGSVGVSIAPNRGGERRQSTIVVGDQRFTVTQEPAPVSGCVYLISSTSQAVLPSGGADVSASVTVASGCAWTASSSVAWVTVIAGASGTGNGSVAFSVAANPGSVRTGTVTVADQTFTVTQAAAAIPTPTRPDADAHAHAPAPAPADAARPTPTPAAPADSTSRQSADASLPPAGGNGPVAVDAGTRRHCGAKQLDLDLGPLRRRAASDRSIVARRRTGQRPHCTITGGVHVHRHPAGAGCTYAINPASLTVAAAGGNGTVTVVRGTGCAWTARSERRLDQDVVRDERQRQWLRHVRSSANDDGRAPDRHIEHCRTHVHGQPAGKRRLILHALDGSATSSARSATGRLPAVDRRGGSRIGPTVGHRTC